MIIKNYFSPPMLPAVPALDLQIIEDVTDVIVYAPCFNAGEIGDIDSAGVTTVYDTNPDAGKCGVASSSTSPAYAGLTRRIDFTRKGVRSRLIVHDHAYVCNDEGRTIEKVSA